MAFKKTMAQRLFSITRCTNPIPTPLKPPLRQSFIPPDPAKRALDPDPGDAGLFCRILQRRSLYQASSPGIRSIPTGPELIEKLRGLDIAKDRIRLDGLIPPTAPTAVVPEVKQLTARDVNKLLRAAQLEMVKAHLRGTQKNWVSYSEFVEICKEGCGGDKERGATMAKLLDDSGAVIILGNSVCLHPHQVVRAVQALIPPQISPKDPRRRQLEAMEKQKAEIDRAADLLVRRELWAGLGYLVLQTAAFVRLTFWELSWDVMEPICFYVTSAYFMAGYTFFLRTSMEPSFEGFFRSRFAAKQKHLMRNRGFDIHKYNELRKACYPHNHIGDQAKSLIEAASSSSPAMTSTFARSMID